MDSDPLDRFPLEARPVVTETLLSRGPAKGSAKAASAAVVSLLAGSLLYWTNLFGLSQFMPASRESVFARGEYWRLFTTLAAHADVQHFLANALPFGILAFLLYGYYGTSVFPLLSVGSGALVTAVSLRTYSAFTTLVGASGMIYWMAAFWLTLYLFIERRIDPPKRVLRAIGFGLVLLVPTVIEPEVSYRSHAIGFGLGVLSGALYLSRRKAAIQAAERVELA